MSEGSKNVVEFRNLDLQRLSRFAELLHRRLPEQIVIGLRGTLGAGKTRLVQAIAAAAGIDVSDVTSPTFTIVQHYHGSRQIHHIDAYRLADEDEFIQLGGEELFDDEAMVLIEWPERISGSLPRDSLMLDIDVDDHDEKHTEGQQTEDHPHEATRTIRATCDDRNLMAIMRQVYETLGERFTSEPNT